MPPAARFKNLDSIRTLAFLSVFLAHSFNTTSAEVQSSAIYRAAGAFRAVYGFGVPVFFVLSGFLITYLMLREQEGVGAFGIRHFYMRRALRIWPVYFLVLLFGFIAFPVLRSLVEPEPYRETASVLCYVLFLSNFDQIRAGTLPYGVGLGPTWSISVEEQYYFLWPLLLALFPRQRFVIPIGIVFIGAMIASPLMELPREHTLFSMIYLSTGAAFGYARFYREEVFLRLVRTPDSIPAVVATTLVAAMYLSTVVASYALIPVIGVMIGYLILHQCHTGGFDLSRIPFLERSGKYTYGLYMYHSICIFAVHSWFQDVLGMADTPWLVVVIKPVLSLTLSFGASYASYQYVERRFLEMKRTRFTPWQADSALTTPAG